MYLEQKINIIVLVLINTKLAVINNELELLISLIITRIVIFIKYLLGHLLKRSCFDDRMFDIFR